MFVKVSCDQPSFRTVEFDSGFNLVLAHVTDTSTEMDTRNGVGKTTLLKIMHYCLGSTVKAKDVFKREELFDWTFSIVIKLKEKEYTISRCTRTPSKVTVEGIFSEWKLPEGFDKEDKKQEFSIREWKNQLGYLIYDLEAERRKFSPTFRSLISYAIRDADALANAFRNTRIQKGWDMQVNNAYLLQLDWSLASEFQVLRSKKEMLNSLRNAMKQGYFGTLGELEAEKVRVAQATNTFEKQLKSFRVHPEYDKIVNDANSFTREIQELLNEQVSADRYLEAYEQAIKEEKDVSIDEVALAYKEASFEFPNQVMKHLQEVEKFHEQLIKNRRDYLESEMTGIRTAIEERRDRVEIASDKRAKLMEILQSHGALREHTALQGRLTESKQKLEELVSRINEFERVENNLSRNKIDIEQLIQVIRRDLQERREFIDITRGYFSENSQYLYGSPGRLSIDVGRNGYAFKVDIEREGSQGIELMKTFCYDMTIAQRRSDSNLEPRLLVHDSHIFDGVDSRQIAKALELAHQESEVKGKFQYIACMNSDAVPYSEFSDGFTANFNKSVIMQLKDSPPSGSLLGIRF